MSAALRIDHYQWRGGGEAMLRFGPMDGPTVIVAPPLFEEANRTRSIIVAFLRAMAARGIGGALPDLPGQGESLVPTRNASLADWRSAFAAAASALPDPVHAVAIRGGTLIDGEARVASRWHLSPVTGAALVRELQRQRGLAEQPTELFVGNDLSPILLGALEDAVPTSEGAVRAVRLAGDPRPADLVLPFAPPWRAAEPRRDDALAGTLADDIAGWIATCAG